MFFSSAHKFSIFSACLHLKELGKTRDFGATQGQDILIDRSMLMPKEKQHEMLKNNIQKLNCWFQKGVPASGCDS